MPNSLAGGQFPNPTLDAIDLVDRNLRNAGIRRPLNSYTKQNEGSLAARLKSSWVSSHPWPEPDSLKLFPSLLLDLIRGPLCPSPFLPPLVSFGPPPWRGVLQTALPDLTPAGTSSSIPGLEEGGTDPWAFPQQKNADKLKGRFADDETARRQAPGFPFLSRV